MNEPGPAITRYAFARGELRGSHLTLYSTSLVHRSETFLEALPLAGMTSVRVSFERDLRKLRWGVALVVVALLMLAIAGPIGHWASTAAAAGQQAIPAMQAVYRMFEAMAALMPVVALACVIGGGALCAFGWMGGTTLHISLPGTERIYSARGRDTVLLDFAEALSERLMLQKK